MSAYPRITEIPAGDDLCWYADDDCNHHADTLSAWIRNAKDYEIDVAAGTVIRVAEKEFPSAIQFVPDFDLLVDLIADAAGDHAAEDYADGYPEIENEAAAKAEFEAFMDAWAEKHLPDPTWWLCVNVREYVITQADIDDALGAATGDSGNG